MEKKILCLQILTKGQREETPLMPSLKEEEVSAAFLLLDDQQN